MHKNKSGIEPYNLGVGTIFIIHMVMAEINDNKFIASCEELRAWVEEHHHFPGDKHCTLYHKIKYTRKNQSRCIGGLEKADVS